MGLSAFNRARELAAIAAAAAPGITEEPDETGDPETEEPEPDEAETGEKSKQGKQPRRRSISG